MRRHQPRTTAGYAPRAYTRVIRHNAMRERCSSVTPTPTTIAVITCAALSTLRGVQNTRRVIGNEYGDGLLSIRSAREARLMTAVRRDNESRREWQSGISRLVAALTRRRSITRWYAIERRVISNRGVTAPRRERDERQQRCYYVHARRQHDERRSRALWRGTREGARYR